MQQFDTHSPTYAQYRPSYPLSVAKKLAGLVKYRGVCWDAGTGTGNMAEALAPHFNLVCATDILPKMLQLAPANKSILYSCQPAEQTDFPDEFFDLIVAAQSAHWFKLDLFYEECKRVAREGAAIALLGYSSPKLPSAIQAAYNYLEHELLGNYWSPQIAILDKEYSEIDFPFQEIKIEFDPIRCYWDAEQLAGFIKSWSATKNFIADGQEERLNESLADLINSWPTNLKQAEIIFPICSRIGYVQ